MTARSNSAKHSVIDDRKQGTMKRTYGLTGVVPEKPLSGQAKAIYDGMLEVAKDGVHEFLDAKAWTELLKDRFKTRQDAYRVVLYYLLIFKKRGLVAVKEAGVESTGQTATEQETVESLQDVPETTDETEEVAAE